MAVLIPRPRVFVSEPLLAGNEKKYVLDCLERNELSSVGSYVKKFEAAFGERMGAEHAVSCCNGTAALHLALLALGIGPGDRVYLPALTYVATANAVKYVGATPVFCDIEPNTWCISPKSVHDELVKHFHSDTPDCSQVILPVDLFGVPADMTRLHQIAEEFGTFIVQDSSESHGSSVEGLGLVGGLADATTFSFYGNKIITSGEGGAITTNDAAVAKELRLYRGQGVSSGNRYWHDVVGYNYRMTNIQAAIALAQLEQMDVLIEKRAEVKSWYDQTLSAALMRQSTPRGSVCWMYSVLLPSEVHMNRARLALAEVGIETRPFFVPMTDLPMYKQQTPPVTRDVASRGLCLPTHPNLTKENVSEIASVIKGVL